MIFEETEILDEAALELAVDETLLEAVLDDDATEDTVRDDIDVVAPEDEDCLDDTDAEEALDEVFFVDEVSLLAEDDLTDEFSEDTPLSSDLSLLLDNTASSELGISVLSM